LAILYSVNAFDAIVGLFFLSRYFIIISLRAYLFIFCCTYNKPAIIEKLRRYRMCVCDSRFGCTIVVDPCFPPANILNTSNIGTVGIDFDLKKYYIIFRRYNHVYVLSGVVDEWLRRYIIYIPTYILGISVITKR